jgi:predicted MFS family arabinose efflux permease
MTRLKIASTAQGARNAGATSLNAEPSRRWLILLVLFVARAAIAFQFQSVPALSPLLVERLQIDYALLGTLVGLYMLPGVVFSLPGGMLGQRFGDKQIALLGLGLMVLGGLWVALSGTYLSASVGRVVSGVGAVVLNIVLAKMVTDWFAGREIVTAMALFVSSWPVGIGLGLLLLPILATTTSAMLALFTTALLSALALMLVLAVYCPPAGFPSASATIRIALSGHEWWASIFAGMVWALFNVGYIVVLAFGPSFLVASGMTLSSAGAITSAVTWAILLSLPLGGYFAQRLRSPDRVMIGCFVLLAALIAALPLGAPPLLVCILIGLLSGPPPGLIMALPAEALRPENRSAGMGVFYTCYYAAMAGLVPVAGVLREALDSASAPLMFGAVMMLLAAVALVCFRLVERRQAAALSAPTPSPASA